jgi:hypothetical protein
MLKRVFIFIAETTIGATALFLLGKWLPKALTENAVTGWIDDHIAEALGLSAPTVATVGSWLLLFFMVAMLILSYHLIISYMNDDQQRRAVAVGRGNVAMLPIILIWIGSFCILGGLTWIYASYRTSQGEILTALQRYVLPRHLNEEQIKLISEHLKKFDAPPIEVKVLTPNVNEAKVFASDIS